jgi:hypothetical protein
LHVVARARRYQQLLNSWKLWTLRARLDVSRALLSTRTDLWLAGYSLHALSSLSAQAAQQASQQLAAQQAALGLAPSLSSLSAQRRAAAHLAAAQQAGSLALGRPTAAVAAAQQAATSAAISKGAKRGIAIRPQVYARCNYCNQSLSLESVAGAKKR